MPQPLDLTGQRFGRLVAREIVGRDGYRILWRCDCDCGRSKVAPTTRLRGGNTRSCGCLHRESVLASHLRRGHKTAEQRIGETHARLTILSIVDRVVGGDCRILTRCECGREHVALLGNVVSGMTRSCGCLLDEARRQPKNVIHGLAHTSEYRTWQGMLRRCENPDEASYHNYGGRGIRVCERWHSFESFYADMGTKPSPRHSLDRINNDGNYEPGNCRWATSKQQCRNTRRTQRFEIDGKVYTAPELYEAAGISRQLFFLRLSWGWTPRAAAFTPKISAAEAAARGKARSLAMRTATKRAVNAGVATAASPIVPTVCLTFGCVERTLVDWCCALGLDVNRVRGRHRAGLPPEVVLSPAPLKRGRKPRALAA
jgi:hypothetical protein